MSSATDSGMIKTMGLVMGALAVFGVIIAIAARMLGGDTEDANDPLIRNALVQRIEPVASVRTSADDLPAGGAATVEVAGAPKTSEELVNGACAACHTAGVAGAPKTGDEAAWAARRETGLDTLVASVINGKGSMPARGGSTYSDEEIRRAVEHLAMFEVTEAAAPAAGESEGAATVEEAPAETPAEEAPAEAPAAESSAEEATSEATAADAGAALVVGQVPEGLTDNIKGTVDGVCAGCHIAGVGGAPKNGDTAAWQARADKGLAALTASVINGLNVMPPRGASTLTDEEIPIAIQYLMSK